MNQAIDLDFIQPPLFSLSQFEWLRLIVLIISLTTVVITWQAYQSKFADLAVLETELSQLKQAQKIQPTAKQVNITFAPEKRKALQESVTTLTMPWSALFEAIEATQHKDVTLLTLEPNAKKQQVMMTGEAKNLQLALQYVAQLQQQPVLSQVFLQKHSVDESNVSKPVRFTVLAKWLALHK